MVTEQDKCIPLLYHFEIADCSVAAADTDIFEIVASLLLTFVLCEIVIVASLLVNF